MLQPTPQLQQERHLKVVELLQAANSQQNVTERVKLLLQSQEVLLKADTLPETVASCVEFYFNLQANSHVPLRRFAAHFLERLQLCKPSLALRSTGTIAALLADSDASVQALALKAAAVHHGRVLFTLSREQDGLTGQRCVEQLRQLQDKARSLLESGSFVLQAATAWAEAVILAQSPSPLLLRARVPPELRGVGCLQDLTGAAVQGRQTAAGSLGPVGNLDVGALQQQAESLFETLRQLLQQAVSGYGDDGRARLPILLSSICSVARQRPAQMPAALETCKTLLWGIPQEALGVAPFAQHELHGLVKEQIQELLASSLTAEWHAELSALLRSRPLREKGSLEDLTTKAKYKQICAVADREGDGPLAPRAKKKARKAEPPKHVWTSHTNPSDEIGSALVCDDIKAFDGDAMLSGEAEATCRHFEDYFGLPSQREPAGHVAGPALLASRISSQAELARIALTSLGSLGMQRSIHRDRAHERIVSFAEVARATRAGANGHVADESPGAAGHDQLLGILTGTSPAPATRSSLSEDLGGKTRDPRAALQPFEGNSIDLGKAEEEESTAPACPLLPIESFEKVKLPQEPKAKDGLQQKLFEEVLESQRRMQSSLLVSGFSAAQVAAYEQMSRQVALHLVASPRAATNPELQRGMCQAYVVRVFDNLKHALQAAGNKPGATASVLEQLVDLFYAKFATDVARWQEAAPGTSKGSLREILEGGGSARRAATSGFTYAELFEMCLAEFEKRDVPRRELRSFLGELPAVPLSAFRALEAQCQLSGARKMALLTILALIEGKPACRWRGLHLLFKLAFSAGEDSSVRFDTIRLIINKIYSVEQRTPMRWQLHHLSDEEALPLLGDTNGTSWELSDPDFLPLQLLRGRCVEDVATLLLRSVASDGAQFKHGLGVPVRLDQLRADLFRGAICAPKDRVWLYLALCIKRPVLLHGLVETFTQCDAEMKEHLVNSIEEAIKYIPATEQELLVLVQKALPETEPLVLKMLTILMSSRINSAESLSTGFGEAVTRLYQVTQNPRLLVPVFDLLDRRNLLDFLPAVLQLEPDQVTDAFRLLVRAKSPPLTVTELLTELHHMNSPGENIVPIKFSMQALNVVFGMREHFDTKVYGIVIQSLVEEPGPLPTLFMRTVIQVVKELPRLSDFIVMEILPRLVRQEVWGDENMWRGFMIVLQYTFASQPTGASRVLAMLPISQLEDVLVQHPDWRQQLREFVAKQPPGSVLPHVRQLLE